MTAKPVPERPEVRTTVSEERGLVATVPTEVYLAYEDRAKEIAARAMTETPVAIKNAILRFALEARLSATSGVSAKLTAYELQVLIGATISGCSMSPDRTFDLPAARARLKGLGLIDRADGIAHATPAGVELVASLLTELQHRREAGILAQDVIDLVIAARMVAYEDQSPEAIRALDKAVEAFAGRVGWENDPDDEALSALGEHP